MSQEFNLASIASVLAPKVYAVDPPKQAIDSFANVEPLSRNDAIQFVDDTFSVVLGLDSRDFIVNLPVIGAKIARKQSFVLTVRISNSDYSVVPAAKDLGAVLLISANAQESYDFLFLASLLAKGDGKPVILFYKPSSAEDELTYTLDDLEKAYGSYDGSSLQDAFQKLHQLSTKTYSELELLPSSGWIATKRYDQVVVFLGDPEPIASHLKNFSVALINVKVYRPFPLAELKQLLTSKLYGYKAVQFVEQSSVSLQFSPLLLDAVEILTSISKDVKVIYSQVLKLDQDNVDLALQHLLSNAKLERPVQNLTFGREFTQPQPISFEDVKASPDNAYLKILQEVDAGVRVLNDYDTNPVPEYALGRFFYRDRQRTKLADLVEQKLHRFQGTLNDDLAQWLLWARNENPPEKYTSEESSALVATLSKSNRTAASELLQFRDFFESRTGWIVGSDSWSYDTGLATFHQALQSGNKRLKLLIIDTDSSVNRRQGKKNLGLYAMNYGNAYVASVALYSSYTQTLTAFIEANAYNQGPAIIIAYLPKGESHLDSLKLTKEAVDSGYWPLYRYNPHLADYSDMFKLDSSFVRRELKEFLDRENRLTLLAEKSAKLQYNLRTYNESVNQGIQQKSKEAFQSLLDNLAGDPMTVAYASDNGNAAGLAKRLANRAGSKGFKVRLAQLDDLSVDDDLPLETNLVVVTSTSGQGEFPNGGKQFWDALRAGTIDLANVHAAVFGLGDSKYWPRAEDAKYYNRPSRQLYQRLELLGAQMLCEQGLGDDQDADGFNTGYNTWEPKLWQALGVSAENADEPPPATNEDFKRESNFLRGTIKEGLADTSTGAMSASDQQLTKFHGVYLQDDRELRDQRKKDGLEPAYAFMVRVRLAGNVSTPDQWLAIDRLADTRGNHTFKITTRGTYQLHGVVKQDLIPVVRDINAVAMDTLGACGDVCRNVICGSLPAQRHIHEQMAHMARIISKRLLPETTAYHEIFLQELGDVPRGEEGGPKRIKVGGNAVQDAEPLLGATYLPRKFKVAITVPPYNDVDVYANDTGLVAIVEDDNIVGFDVLIGGGMGTTHNNTKTYPRAGTNIGYVPYDKAPLVCEKMLIMHRDYGDRKNRKHARLKYTIDDMGVPTFKARLEELLGFKFEKSRPFKIDSNIDYFGWCKDETGLNHYTCYIENGRVSDTLDSPHKEGLHKIAQYLKETGVGLFRLTSNQHVIISDITDEHVPKIKALLREYKFSVDKFSGLRKASQSCVAFPTCGLAMAEAERYLPQFLDRLEGELEKLGLRNDSIVLRMTGCPNGCARPWLAEVALVGKSYGFYNLMLGGSYNGDRVNKIFKSNVDEDQAIGILVPLFSRWASERKDGEHFGDFVIRAGVIKPTLEGKKFWEDVKDF
ncbi:DEKNAAC101426 [Brettanomyces naardenensis]|uniref:assimilatory sulfite reductase (NADPH) n=1 Tax=Brettanomyces naardenensis TaxID=13370 RepID=A0A448YHU4_BRENA|nr:DEKNAAC101426 [Brettanomyces naardenensis]